MYIFPSVTRRCFEAPPLTDRHSILIGVPACRVLMRNDNSDLTLQGISSMVKITEMKDRLRKDRGIVADARIHNFKSNLSAPE